MNFVDLGLDQWIIKLAQKISYEQPRQIQQLAIPEILKGSNTIITSATGSGKTAAFAFPILQQLSKDPFGIHTIILTASRELALQIAEQFSIFGAPMNLKIAVLIGGLSISKQISVLSSIPHIIIGTPGRCLELLKLNDHFKKYIKNTQYVVLDEVDRLLEPQIWQDIEEFKLKMHEAGSKAFKLILVSATLGNIKNDLQKYFQNAEFIECNALTHTNIPETISNKFILMPDMVKEYYFIYLMRKLDGIATIVFTPTCRKCHELSALLNHLGLKSVMLHSLMKQTERIDNLRQFRKQAVTTLVATDVASRGLDIPVVKYVVNFNVPLKGEDYVHRIGRTARGGKRGTSITLMTQFDVDKILNIEEFIGLKLDEIKFNEDKVLTDMVDITKAIRKIKILQKSSQEGMTDFFNEKKVQRLEMKKQKKPPREEAVLQIDASLV